MPGYGAQYWAERTADNRRRSYPTFKGAHTADVVVIGGGLTGCTAAAVLAGGGLSVVLVEANRIATGATAGSLGAIVPQPDAMFRSVEEAAGVRVARTAWKEAHRSAREFASALKKLPVKCDLTAVPALVNARTPDAAAALSRERAARKAAGIDAPWISKAAAAAEIGTDTAGAIRLRDAFLFDPVRASLGLAGLADAKGARIFERALVKRTRFTRKYADVVLDAGTIRTTAVVVATGGPGTLFSQLRRHVREADGFVVVTEPLSAAMRRETGRRMSVMTEAGEAPPWLRWLPDDRAMFAGALGPRVGPRQVDKAIIGRTSELMYELSVRYPVISGLPARWGWRVPVVRTPDGVPWIGPHRNYPFHFFAMAFGWHGDSLAWLSAKAALRYFSGNARKEDDAFGFVRHLG
jgi:glycine/D-amino acid oxidase-like deaminating enzyme